MSSDFFVGPTAIKLPIPDLDVLVPFSEFKTMAKIADEEEYHVSCRPVVVLSCSLYCMLTFCNAVLTAAALLARSPLRKRPYVPMDFLPG